jgi:hypothetical protein
MKELIVEWVTKVNPPPNVAKVEDATDPRCQGEGIWILSCFISLRIDMRKE